MYIENTQRANRQQRKREIEGIILNEQIEAGSTEIINIEIKCDSKKYKEYFIYLRNGYFKRIYID